MMIVVRPVADSSPTETLTMPSKRYNSADLTLVNFNRSPVEQVLENLRQALRVLELVPSSATELTPHPLVVVRAEIETARRYLSQIRLYEANDGLSNASIPMLEVA